MRLPNNTTEKCSFCNARAMAVWGSNAEPIVFICEKCALELMPKLAADAVSITATTDLDELNGKGAMVHQTFLDALVRRLQREIKQ